MLLKIYFFGIGCFVTFLAVMGEGDWKDFEIGERVFFALLAWGFFLVVLWENKKMQDFNKWIKEDIDKVLTGVAMHRGRAIGFETEFVQYKICVFFIFGLYDYSVPYLKGSRQAMFMRIYSIIVSLLYGWWNIPFGPIYALRTIFHNIRGGRTVTLAKLVELEKTEQK